MSLALSANGARYARVGPSRGVQLGEHAARRAVPGIFPDSSAGSVGGGAASHRHVLPAAAEAAPTSRRHNSRAALCNRGSDSTRVPLCMHAQTRRWRILRHQMWCQDESEMSQKWVENGPPNAPLSHSRQSTLNSPGIPRTDTHQSRSYTYQPGRWRRSTCHPSGNTSNLSGTCVEWQARAGCVCTYASLFIAGSDALAVVHI